MEQLNKELMELKAQAYDLIGQFEFIRNNLASVNNAIGQKQNQINEELKKEVTASEQKPEGDA